MAENNCWVLHDEACDRGDATYVDPQSGYRVFTRVALQERGRCCGAGCRHCPFNHQSVPASLRAARIQQAAWLNDLRPNGTGLCGLFWSGGKDSFLAYRYLIQRHSYPVVLVTTFDRESGVIAHQDLSIETIVAQAQHLKLPLIGIPLHSGLEYLDHVASAFELVPGIASLAFGDLHLDHIRQWREEAFGGDMRTRHLTLHFPVWQIPYDELLREFERSAVSCTLSAVSDQAAAAGLRIGDQFNTSFVRSVPTDVDAFGENGEFHTEVRFTEG